MVVNSGMNDIILKGTVTVKLKTKYCPQSSVYLQSSCIRVGKYYLKLYLGFNSCPFQLLSLKVT